MQRHVVQKDNALFKSTKDSLKDPFMSEVLGVINPYAPGASLESDAVITQKQIEILEDAIKRYERLEDVRKFSSLVLDDIETVTEEDIQRALELESTVSIEDEKAVLNLIQNEGFLRDLESADFTEILASCEGVGTEDINAQKIINEDEDFSDFDF